jgi:hypothetical protein
MLKRTSVVAGVAAATLLGTAVQALADGPFGSVDCAQNPQPECQLGAGQGGHNGGDAAGGGEGTVHVGGDGGDPSNDWVECRYEPVNFQSPAGQPAGPGGWFMVVCSPDGKDPLTHGPVWIPAGVGVAPTLSPAEVAQMARQRLRLPAPTIAASPVGDQLVNLPTWLWLSSGWAPTSATASVPGVSVSATASPTSVSWAMGDGGTATCSGPGTPFPAGGDSKAASPDCGYTYRRSSAGQPRQAFPISATVHWTVTWSGAGQRGTFPNITTTSNAAFRVAESQALNNGGG